MASGPIEALKQLDPILSSTGDFIALLDTEGKFLYLNKIVSGLTKEEVMGKGIDDFVPPDFAPIVRDAITKCVTTKQPVSYQTTALGPDKSNAFYFCRLSLCEFEGVPMILCISTDITDFKKLEVELKERIKASEIINQSMMDREIKMVELKKELEDLKKGTK